MDNWEGEKKRCFARTLGGQGQGGTKESWEERKRRKETKGREERKKGVHEGARSPRQNTDRRGEIRVSQLQWEQVNIFHAQKYSAFCVT